MRRGSESSESKVMRNTYSRWAHNPAFTRIEEASGSSAKNSSNSSVEELHSDSDSSIEARRLNASTTSFLSATPLRKCPVARHQLPRLKQLIFGALPRSKSWRIQAVEVSPDRFESRKALLAQWRGLRDDDLSKETGILGCVFVHMSGSSGATKPSRVL
ncbi:hypothetical protein CRG98_019680 [Punica granatum]|uniref:Uncharacterized protein n=1 Tax=Punica granatum TaxID=22663 RepID=A0A2I0JUB7_PUNGR|nr:hypothetical protein CRG98_019680 [Punica granatum]